MLKPVNIFATTLSDAWHQLVFKVIEPGYARKRMVDQGFFDGTYRLEFDYVTVHIVLPGTRSLLPEFPIHLGIPDPVSGGMEYVDGYFERYLMSDRREGSEQYTYGMRLIAGDLQPIAYIDRNQTFLEGCNLPTVNQVEVVIDRYKKFGPGNNQLIMRVGQPADIMLKDSPCLCHIDTRIEEGKLHFIIYFRSWDLWGGFPANLAGIQLLKEYMSNAIGVEDGEMICSSKGLHLYGYAWSIAGTRRGLTEGEMKELLSK